MPLIHCSEWTSVRRGSSIQKSFRYALVWILSVFSGIWWHPCERAGNGERDHICLIFSRLWPHNVDGATRYADPYGSTCDTAVIGQELYILFALYRRTYNIYYTVVIADKKTRLRSSLAVILLPPLPKWGNPPPIERRHPSDSVKF